MRQRSLYCLLIFCVSHLVVMPVAGSAQEQTTREKSEAAAEAAVIQAEAQAKKEAANREQEAKAIQAKAEAQKEAVVRALKAKAVQAQNESAQKEESAKTTEETSSKLNKAKIAELTALIKKDEYNPTSYFKRGMEYVKGEAWKEAAADFMEIPKLKDGDTQLGQQIGLLLALSGNKDSLEVLAKEMLRVYGGKQAFQQERTAKVCCLTSNVTGDMKDIEKMAAFALEKNMAGKFALHYFRTQALVQYRAKKYDEALKTIAEAEARNPETTSMIPNVLMCHRAIETMCLYQLKKVDEAKKVFEKATADLAEHYETNPRVYMPGLWHDWLTAKLLHKEAEELLKKQDKK